MMTTTTTTATEKNYTLFCTKEKMFPPHTHTGFSGFDDEQNNFSLSM
jgi:hypothetical protein